MNTNSKAQNDFSASVLIVASADKKKIRINASLMTHPQHQRIGSGFEIFKLDDSVPNQQEDAWFKCELHGNTDIGKCIF